MELTGISDPFYIIDHPLLWFYTLKTLVNSSICCPGCAAYIQVCRGLMISAVCLGFFGAILALVGMKCTKIGGSETTKARIACLAGLHFILSGKCLYTTVLLNTASRPRVVRNQYFTRIIYIPIVTSKNFHLVWQNFNM